MKKNSNTITRNKKANFNFEIKKQFEAGIVLKGTEVKSIRLNSGNFNISESYVKIHKGNVLLINSSIGKYSKGNINNHDEFKDRILLLNKREINQLRAVTKEKSLTIVPLYAYWNRGLIKICIGLAKGRDKTSKKKYLIEKDIDRNTKNSLINL